MCYAKARSCRGVNRLSDLDKKELGGIMVTPGAHTGGETPVPIPNTEVKPARADGTWEGNPLGE